MNIIIVGCGKIGSALAERLNSEGHDITLVDRNERRLRDLALNLDVIGVTGNGAMREVQQEANVENADLFIAVTGSDEVNMLCCLIAKKEGRCKTIARIRSAEYEAEKEYLRNAMGISYIINPEKMCAHEIVRLLRFSSALEIETFSNGRVDMIKMKLSPESPLAGMALKDLSRKIPENALICMVERNGDSIIPSGDTVLEAGDHISFITTPDQAAAFSRRIKPDLRQTKSAIFVGAGKIANYTAWYMRARKSKCDLKFIDIKADICQELSEKYPEYTFINADGSDKNVLLEEGLQNADVLAAITGIDEENIVLSLMANDLPGLRKIAKVNRIDPHALANNLNLDAIVSPKLITADSIVRFVRAMENSADYSLEYLYKVSGGRVEAQEYEITTDSEVTNVSLKDMSLKAETLIAAIIRQQKLVRPGGNDCLKKGDHVVIITKASNKIRNLADILA